MTDDKRLIDVLRTLSGIEQAIHAQSEPRAVAQNAVDALEQRLGYEFGAVLLVDESTDRLAPIALSRQGRDDQFVEADRAFVTASGARRGRGITGWVARTGECYLSGDVRRDRRYLGLRNNIRSEACVPIGAAGQVIGVLNIETPRPNAYGYLDVEVLKAVAGQISTSLLVARLDDSLRVSRKREALGQLTGQVVHDLRHLTLATRENCRLLATDVGGNLPALGRVREIEQSARQVAGMSDQILDFMRHRPVKAEPLSVSRVMSDMEPVLRRIIGESVRLTVRYRAKRDVLMAARALVEQVVMNLVMNSRQSVPEGGRILVETSDSADRLRPHAVLAVRDNGRGMNGLARRRLSRGFYTTSPGGSGLGLAIVQRGVEQLGGRVEFRSSPARGTTFRVYLPTDPSLTIAT